MRKTRIRGATAVVALALIIAACGGSDDVATPTPAPTPAPEAPAEDPREGALIIDDEIVADRATWEAAQAEGTLLVYTGLTEANEVAIIEAFTADTGINVEYIRLTENRLYERILSEQATGALEADIIRIADPSMIKDWDDLGIIAEHRVPMWDEIDEAFKREGKYYVGFQTANMIGYNSALVSEEDAPKSWEDLTDPKWKGRNGLVQVTAGGSVWALALFQRQVVSDDYWQRLAANDPVILTGAASVTQEMTRGEILVASVLPRVLNAAIRDGAPLKVVVPEEGAAMYGFFISKTTTGKNPNAAAVYVNWQMSKRGQTFFSKFIGDYPVRAGIPTPVVDGVALPDRSQAFLWDYTTDDWTNLREAYTQEWFTTFNYTPPAS